MPDAANRRRMIGLLGLDMWSPATKPSSNTTRTCKRENHEAYEPAILPNRQGEARGDDQEATVDAYNESEQTTGWFTMIDENLAVPFETTVLGVQVTVERVDLNESEQIVALCKRGRNRQSLPILDLPLPTPPPDGAEWIEAYRQWRE